MSDRLYQYALLMRLHRPVGIGLLLWPTLWALWIAGNGKPSPLITLIFVLGVVLMRSAGCVINDYADQPFDGYVQRTRERPLVTGKVTRWEALILFGVLCAAAALLLLGLNRATVWLAGVAVLLAVIYPFMKRITHLPQLFLGMAFAWGIPMAFVAQTDTLPLNAWLLFLGTLLWIVAYDTLYAMADREEDKQIGVKSTAILFGRFDRGMIGLLLGAALLLFAVVGMRLAMDIVYYIGLLLAALLAIYQLYLIRDRDPRLCFKAFLRNNEFGAMVF
ncbi:MAG: 4-hydroxybenzoate octaprenyltransferase, partial [Gammaproteobacteria bacterium]